MWVRFKVTEGPVGSREVINLNNIVSIRANHIVSDPERWSIIFTVANDWPREWSFDTKEEMEARYNDLMGLLFS